MCKKMGRNCCCINGSWLKGHSRDSQHPQTGKFFNNDLKTHPYSHTHPQSSASPIPHTKKKHHSLSNGRCIRTVNTVNGHIYAKRCDSSNGRKTFATPLTNCAKKLSHSCESAHHMTALAKWKTNATLMYSIIFAVSIGCFLNSINGEFVHDDIVAITTNPDVSGKTKLFDIFRHDYWGKPMNDPDSHKSYRPLTTLTFRLNMHFSTKTLGFHGINTLFHGIDVLLITYFTRDELKFTMEESLLTGLLFASHPIHCEAVSSIVGRADLLCCIFYMVSFIAFVRSLRYPTLSKPMVMYLLICQISSILALLSKEQGITVLGLCIVYYFFTKRQRLKLPFLSDKTNKDNHSDYINKVWLYGPIVSVVITLIFSLWFRILLLNGTLPYFTEQDNPASFSKSSLTRFLTYSYLSSFNARLILSPLTMSYDWQMGSIPLIRSISDPRNISTMVLVGTLVAILLKLYRHTVSSRAAENMEMRSLCVGMAMLTLPFIPASNLFVNVGFVIAERVLYIPSFGMIILVVLGLRMMSQSERSDVIRLAHITRSALFILCIIFALKTYRQNKAWISREALFESGLKSVPQNAKTHYNYANLQKDLGNIELAMVHYRSALSLWPDHASAHNNLGTILCELSETDEAERHFKAALAINPFHPRAHFNLANIYSKQGMTEKAISLLKQSIELDALFPEPYSALASLYAGSDRIEEAKALHLKALELDPENADFCNNYGAFLQKIGQTDLAVEQYLRAITIQPNHTVALVNAARTLWSMIHNKRIKTLFKR